MKFPLPPTFIFRGSEAYGFSRADDKTKLEEDMSSDQIPDHFDLSDPSQPCCVQKLRSTQSICRSNTTAVSRTSFATVLRQASEMEDLVCIQKFIKLRTKASKPKVIRVSYSHQTSEPKPYGVAITCKGTPSRSNLVEEELTSQFCASSSGEVSIYKIAGKALEEAASICHSVTYFIENYFGLHLSRVTVDLASDDSGMLQVLQLKSFRLKTRVSPRVQLGLLGQKYSRRGSTTTTANAVWIRDPALKLRRMESSVCCLCRRARAELSKLLTFRLANRCIGHLLKRLDGNAPLNIRKRRGGESHFRCCDVCYSIVMNEQELIRLSRRLRIAVGLDRSGPSVGCRIMVVVGEMSDTPSSFVYQKMKIHVTMKNVFHIESGESRRIHVFDTGHDVLDESQAVEINVYIGNSIVGFGSVSVFEKLISQSRFTQSGSVTSVQVFLGVRKWNIELTFGISKLINAYAGPLPDAWMERL